VGEDAAIVARSIVQQRSQHNRTEHPRTLNRSSS
jgi:hypothetical protein